MNQRPTRAANAVCWVQHLTQEPPLATPNYAYEKRQRELAKKRKAEEKRQRKQEQQRTTVGDAPAETPAEAIPPVRSGDAKVG